MMVDGVENTMKFLLIAGYPDSLLNFRGHLMDALRSAGLEVHVAAPGLNNSPILEVLESKGVISHDIPLQRAGLNPVKDLVSIFSLWRLMDKIKPDYVLGYTIKPVIYGSLAALLSRVPHRYALITGLGYTFTDSGRGGRSIILWIARVLYSVALKNVKKVFFQNPDDEALFRSVGILRSDAASRVVNGSGIDLDGFAVAPLPELPIRFLLIARLLGDKGVREYAKAAQLIHLKHPEVRFGLVGWIDDNPDSITQQELDGWITEGDIEFYGKQDDVRHTIAKCSVYVLPSYREGTPRTVLEAMAMGRPIITTDAPGCRETVVDGENGFLVQIRSVEALVEAVEKFIKNPKLIEKMGKRSREIAEDKYDVHKVNAFMLQEMGIKP